MRDSLLSEELAKEKEVPEKVRFSPLKTGCLFSVFFILFWVILGGGMAVLGSHMLKMPQYSLMPTSHDAAVLCREKIKEIDNENFYNKDFVTISEKELNSFSLEEYSKSSIIDVAISLVTEEIKVSATFIPVRIPAVNSLLKHYLSSGEEGMLKSLGVYLEDFKLRLGAEARFWVEENGEPDFELKGVSVGEQKFPAGLVSDIIKRFVPQYRIFLSIEGVEKILLENEKISFFREKEE